MFTFRVFLKILWVWELDCEVIQNFVFFYRNIPQLGRNLLIRVLGGIYGKKVVYRPRELVKALIMATTQEKDLVVDPCTEFLSC